MASWCSTVAADPGPVVTANATPSPYSRGERSAAELPELEEVCLDAYVAGLRAEGCDISLETVRREHALTMLLFWGLSAVPLEIMFGAPPPPPDVFSERASAARFVLDLVDITTPAHTARRG